MSLICTDVSEETPLQEAPVLSAKYRNQVYFKREDLQPVFSFKIRGAYNKIASLTQEQLANGIVACSAGNHAQVRIFVINNFQLNSAL